MSVDLSEEDVHKYIYDQGLENLMRDDSEVSDEPAPETSGSDEPEVELWRIIKDKAKDKIRRIHSNLRYGEFIGSKVKLPIDKTRSMELDILGTYEDGIFVLELKINRSAERNAFSELFAYSNYIAEMFALSGRKDITNVLIANLDVKITKQAFLYDL